jgi:signal transduction histidine kinase
MFTWGNLSRDQKILLISSCVLYVLVIFGFFNFDLYLIIVLFVLHSISLILFTYVSLSTKTDEDGLDDLRQEIGIMRAENAQTVRDCDEKVASIKKEMDDLELCLEDERNKNKELSDALEKERNNKESERVNSFNDDAFSSLLPPAADGEENRVVDIIAIAKETAEEFRESARQAGLTINVVATEEALEVRASARRIKIMFKNIIDNSIKYMQKEGALVITISTINDDIFIVLKDSGNGLSENETKHIFELNFQGSNRISGNGLGLTQAKAIVDYYGGNIYARSSQGKGMGVYIQLPAETAKEE